MAIPFTFFVKSVVGLLLTTTLIACTTQSPSGQSPTGESSVSPSAGASAAPSTAPVSGSVSRSQYLAQLNCYTGKLSGSALVAISGHKFQVESMTDAQFTQNLSTVFGSSVKTYQDKAVQAGCN